MLTVTDIDSLAPALRSRLEIDATGCWLWTGKLTPMGYGTGTGGLAHRTVWKVLVGPIDRRTELHHKCHVRLCVNPGHLQPVTRKEHQQLPREMRPSCPAGHEFTPENTWIRKSGSRVCRACKAARQRRFYRARNPEQERTACNAGHPRTPENSRRRRTGGGVRCLMCAAHQQRRRRAERRQRERRT